MAEKPGQSDHSAGLLDHEPEVSDTDSKGPSRPHIRCPLCGWSPTANSRWMCKCGHVWNTFDTGGVCPGCLYQWQITVCLSCHKISPHSNWYQQ